MHLKDLDAEAFARRAGYYLGELNAIHPFRVGTGGRSESSSGNWLPGRDTA
jgi:fido (protein-threonine AMPylation protein)